MICKSGWTKTVRPPTSLTNKIMLRIDQARGLPTGTATLTLKMAQGNEPVSVAPQFTAARLLSVCVLLGDLPLMIDDL